MLASLKSRLIVSGCAIVTLAMAVATAVNFVTIRKHTYASLDEQTMRLSTAYSDKLAEWVQSKRNAINALDAISSGPDAVPLLQAAQVAGAFDLAFLGTEDGRMEFSSPRDVPVGFDPRGRPWYRQAVLADGAVVISEPLADASSGKLAVTFSRAIGAAPHVSVVGGDVLLDNVVAAVQSIRPTPRSFAFLIDSRGKVLAQPTDSTRASTFEQFGTDVTKGLLDDALGRAQGMSLKARGRSGLLYARNVKGTDWTLAVIVDEEEATSGLRAILESAAIVTVVVVLLSLLILSTLIFRAMKQLADVRAALADIASGEGDLTRRLHISGPEELKQIAIAFNQFADKISHALHAIRSASAAVDVSAHDLAHANQDLAARTERQASALEETAAMMEQLKATVKKNSESAALANDVAVRAMEAADAGGQVVLQVVESMSDIAASSKTVANIVGAIDEIASQTNILALNAAVEAAQAGAQGEGFAVVAAEVRNLAQRCAAAAREIGHLVDESVSRVEQGSSQVTEAGKRMNDIVAQVQRVTGLMGEIRMAGEDQYDGIDQASIAIGDIDQVTQQNAALVEVAAAAATGLREQSSALYRVVAAFKLDEGSRTISRAGGV